MGHFKTTVNPRAITRFLLLVVLIFPFLSTPSSANLTEEVSASGSNHFKISPGLRSRVDFWVKVYTQYSTNEAIVHDSNNLDIIYEVVSFGDKKFSRRTKERKLRKVKNKYKKILRGLTRKKDKSNLTGDEKRVFELVKDGFYRASRNIRVQIGQKDRFREGLERSGMFKDRIEEIFRQKDLPVELGVLPHVESSFHLGAYSSAGAAGIWQFTRGTGRRFLRVRYDVDERRDPILSTYAAGELLKKNYAELKSWPLAITAYNHGLRGMQRAQKRYGNDIEKIIRSYKSRSFGFASSNFYCEFLAALQVTRNHNNYFPDLNFEKPRRFTSFRLGEYIYVKTAMKYFQMTREEIADANPSLRNPVINGRKRIPRGFVFKVPREKHTDLGPLYKTIPVSLKYNQQVRSKWYTVRRRDTLSGIALRYGTTVRQIKSLNKIGRRNRIYVGKVLRLPGSGRAEKFHYRTAQLNHGAVQKLFKETGTYRVRRYDNLTKIARRFDTQPEDLVLLNDLKNPNSLYPGQMLRVRGKSLVAQATKNTAASSKQEKLAAVKSPQLKTESGWDKNKADRVIPVAKPGNKLNPGVKVQLAIGLGTWSDLNKNRPAFLPVAFVPEEHQGSRVGVITVDFDETLSHFADWASLSVGTLRRFNNIKRRGRIAVHSKLKVPFTNSTPDKFEEKRQEYHKAIQEDFFTNFKVSKLIERSVKKGETLWEICNEINVVPIWLLGSYNSDKDIHTLSVGQTIVIPVITPLKSTDT